MITLFLQYHDILEGICTENKICIVLKRAILFFYY